MGKKSKSEVFKEVKDEEEMAKRKNFTFNLPQKLMEDFIEQCKNRGISQAKVLEKLIRELMDN